MITSIQSIQFLADFQPLFEMRAPDIPSKEAKNMVLLRRFIGHLLKYLNTMAHVTSHLVIQDKITHTETNTMEEAVQVKILYLGKCGI
jgi:hypothetical protein